MPFQNTSNKGNALAYTHKPTFQSFFNRIDNCKRKYPVKELYDQKYIFVPEQNNYYT